MDKQEYYKKLSVNYAYREGLLKAIDTICRYDDLITVAELLMEELNEKYKESKVIKNE